MTFPTTNDPDLPLWWNAADDDAREACVRSWATSELVIAISTSVSIGAVVIVAQLLKHTALSHVFNVTNMQTAKSVSRFAQRELDRRNPRPE